jgi:hypothetical protein
LRPVLDAWAASNPRAALNWVIEHPDVGAQTLNRIGDVMGQRDFDVAMSFTVRIPDEMRSTWVQRVAVAHAAVDPLRAAEAIAQYEGRAGFEASLVAILQQSANSGRLDLSDQIMKSAPVSVQLQAVPFVAQAQARADPSGAERWASNLPQGQLRDRALETLLTVAAGRGNIDTRLLSQFSSDRALQEGLVPAIVAVSYRDRDVANQLIDTYILENSLREQIETMLELSSGS